MFADMFGLAPEQVRRMSVSEFEQFRQYADNRNREE